MSRPPTPGNGSGHSGAMAPLPPSRSPDTAGRVTFEGGACDKPGPHPSRAEPRPHGLLRGVPLALYPAMISAS